MVITVYTVNISTLSIYNNRQYVTAS